MGAQARLSMIEEHSSSTCLESVESSGFGGLLRLAREDRGLSIDAVANILHIRECYLKAIESDHIDELPREFVYWSGFIRTYAQFLDLDGQEIIRQIEKNRSYSVKSADEKLNCYTDTLSDVSTVRSYALLISGMIAGIILFLSAFIFKYTWISKQSLDSEARTIEKKLTTSPEFYRKEDLSPCLLGPINYKQTMVPVIRAIKTKKRTSTMDTSSRDNAPEAWVQIIEPCWVEVYDSMGLTLFKKQMFPGQNFKIKEGSMMTIGNAAGVKLIFSDFVVKSLGQKNQVIRNLMIKRENLRKYDLAS